MTEAPQKKYVGGGVPRKEDPALVTGRATWTDRRCEVTLGMRLQF